MELIEKLNKYKNEIYCLEEGFKETCKNIWTSIHNENYSTSEINIIDIESSEFVEYFNPTNEYQSDILYRIYNKLDAYYDIINDISTHMIVSIDIDIYSDGNYLAIQDEIERIMEDNEFVRSGCSPDMYEEDTGLFHKTIEFEKERMR